VNRRPLLVPKVWIQVVVLIFVFGFLVLGMLAWGTYAGAPPIPATVTDPAGRVLFTHADVVAGQQTFLRNGLMEYGSIFGHGAYLGPDFTADYLHRAALAVLDAYGGAGSDRARAETVADFKTNRFNDTTRTLIYTGAQAGALDDLTRYYRDFFGQPTTTYGLRPRAIADPQAVRQLTAFFSWSAWAAAALRPGRTYSYTNN